MSRITAIKQQQRNQQRVNIYLDGEYRCALYRITAAWLYVGQEVGEEQIAALLDKDGREAAYQQALRLLERRERSTEEISRRLRQKGFSESIIAELITRMQETGLVNDSRFARSFVESRENSRPRSRRALSMELRQRGLDDAEIAAAVANVNEEQMAYQAGIKQSRRLQALEWPGFRLKLSAFLARRGFSYDVIAVIVRRIWDEQHSEDDGSDDLSEDSSEDLT